MGTRKLRVGVIFGGRSGEHDVSLMSANGIVNAIDKEKYEVVLIGITRSGKWLPPGQATALLTGDAEAVPPAAQEWSGTALVADPQAGAMVTLDGAGGKREAAQLQSFDVVFPVLHGPYGEDGTVQGFLELANIPYVGAGVLGSALGMDKVKMKELLRYHGLPVADWVWFRRWQWREERETVLRHGSGFGFPCFVKPANLGSSVGVSKAHGPEELPQAIEEALRHDEKVMVERAIDARELEVAVLGNHRPEASVPGEIIPSNEFYDYSAKYLDGRSELLIPAPLPPDVTARIRELAVKAFVVLECFGLARVDFFLERHTNQLFVNEINTLPGFTPISMYPKLWEASGLSYRQLIDRLLQLAIERWQERNTR
ncbi:MAG TPA: D-alanine--D-alanine ligase family protein [Chloroflexota bacterium]|nr:D-alanine--D-alanine ligase family protein [Chloroflexota bacterium]